MIKPGIEIVYKLMKPFVILKFRCKYHPVVYGKENIPKTGAFIICGNHRHKDDQYNVMMVTKRVLHFMAKEEYFENGKMQELFYRLAGCIKVDRRIHDENAKSEALELLSKGKCVGIFPEGTRNKTFGTKNEVIMLPFKFGAVSLAQKANVPIIPFATRGEYNGKKGQLITNIGEAIDVSNMDLTSANDLLRNKILELIEK